MRKKGWLRGRKGKSRKGYERYAGYDGYSIWEALLGLLLFSLCAGLAAGGLSLARTAWTEAVKKGEAQLLFHTAAGVISGELLAAKEVWNQEGKVSFFSLERGFRISIESSGKNLYAVAATGQKEELLAGKTLPEGLWPGIREFSYQKGKFRFLLQVRGRDKVYEEQELWVRPLNQRTEKGEGR